ncbi:flavodoxin domain-containing protein [Dactylosporangium sp. CS-047395]|uniref:flavodoxin domain-containing protein n=1 Tax=Dactylosporangium sp. CS-047395 TaxID=3239936 RepID=UPI003D8FC185
MRVLVTAASKHGSTADIADVIGKVLQHTGQDVTILPIGDVTTVEEYDAVILGSAVYLGHWLPPAVAFAARHGDALTRRVVYLFSSGPMGEPAIPAEDPVDVQVQVTQTGAREHQVFTGRLTRSSPTLGERAMVAALRAPYDDFRDLVAVRQWAQHVAVRLATGT